eukprot:1765805-Rhodomonas_salina.2
MLSQYCASIAPYAISVPHEPSTIRYPNTLSQYRASHSGLEHHTLSQYHSRTAPYAILAIRHVRY